MLFPVSQPFSVTVDANGNAQKDVSGLFTGNWSMVMLTARHAQNVNGVQVPVGTPLWQFIVDKDVVSHGTGPAVELGPRPVAPKSTISINLTGGIPGANVIGLIHGLYSNQPNAHELLQSAYTPAPNSIAIQNVIPRKTLYPIGVTPPVGPQIATTPSFTVAASGTVNTSFIIPTGTVAIRVLANSAGLAFSYTLGVIGHQSGQQYFGSPTQPGTTVIVPIPAFPITIPIESDWDTQLDITATAPSTNTGPVSFFISALFSSEQPGQAGAAQQVFVPSSTPVSVFPSSWNIFGVQDSGAPALGVQASATLPSIAGRFWIVRVISADLGAIAAPAANAVRLQLIDNAGPLTRWSRIMALPAVAGAVDHLTVTDLSIPGTLGGTMTLQFSSAIPGFFQSCNIGADLNPLI